MKVQNAKTLPKVYYGLHFCPGVAEYREPSQDPYRIFINEDTIRSMNPTFAGRPVYVQHVDTVDLSKLQEEADGYVIESFFNSADGKTWAKFIVVSDKGHQAILNGWKLSNAYVPQSFGAGGVWNGVDYSKEVIQGEFEHLAIVPNPRYDESIILDAEQFKAYNSDKEMALSRIANSQGESKMNFFKKTKVENATDLENTMVTLVSGKSVSIKTLVNEAEEMEKKKNEEAQGEMPMVNGEHMVCVGDEKMSVNALIEKHLNMLSEKKNAEDAESAKKKDEPAKEEEKKEDKVEDAKKNEDEEDKKKEEVKKNSKHFDELKNAHKVVQIEEKTLDMSDNQVERGKSRYGSK